MKRRNRIITVMLTAAVTYGVLFSTVGFRPHSFRHEHFKNKCERSLPDNGDLKNELPVDPG